MRPEDFVLDANGDITEMSVVAKHVQLSKHLLTVSRGIMSECFNTHFFTFLLAFLPHTRDHRYPKTKRRAVIFISKSKSEVVSLQTLLEENAVESSRVWFVILFFRIQTVQ